MRKQVSSFHLECLYRRSFPRLSWQPSALPAVLPVVKFCLTCNLSVPCWSLLLIFSSTQHNGSVFTQQLPCACCRSSGISSLLGTDSRLVLTSLCTGKDGSCVHLLCLPSSVSSLPQCSRGHAPVFTRWNDHVVF